MKIQPVSQDTRFSTRRRSRLWTEREDEVLRQIMLARADTANPHAERDYRRRVGEFAVARKRTVEACEGYARKLGFFVRDAHWWQPSALDAVIIETVAAAGTAPGAFGRSLAQLAATYNMGPRRIKARAYNLGLSARQGGSNVSVHQ